VAVELESIDWRQETAILRLNVY